MEQDSAWLLFSFFCDCTRIWRKSGRFTVARWVTSEPKKQNVKGLWKYWCNSSSHSFQCRTEERWIKDARRFLDPSSSREKWPSALSSRVGALCLSSRMGIVLSCLWLWIDGLPSVAPRDTLLRLLCSSSCWLASPVPLNADPSRVRFLCILVFSLQGQRPSFPKINISRLRKTQCAFNFLLLLNEV